MPTILEKNGFRFYFYSADYLEPMHVHVEGGNGDAKFWLKPIHLASSYKLKGTELKRIRTLIEENERLFEEKWNEYFSKTPGR